MFTTNAVQTSYSRLCMCERQLLMASKSLRSALLSWYLLSSTQDESKNTTVIKEKFLHSTPCTSTFGDNHAKITKFAFSFRSKITSQSLHKNRTSFPSPPPPSRSTFRSKFNGFVLFIAQRCLFKMIFLSQNFLMKNNTYISNILKRVIFHPIVKNF